MCPCQQCDSELTITVWLPVLLVLVAGLLWRHWGQIGWTGRISAIAACVVVAGGGMVMSYTHGQEGTRSGTCDVSATPGVPLDGKGPASLPGAESRVAAPAPTTQEAGASVSPVSPDGTVIVYYFHRTVRCHSCLLIEEWAKQAVEESFPNEMATGLVEWRSVNFEEPGNEHFVEEYELPSPSLVFARVGGGPARDWQIVAAVWDLLNDPAQFTRYVQGELASFLAQAPGTSGKVRKAGE